MACLLPIAYIFPTVTPSFIFIMNLQSQKHVCHCRQVFTQACHLSCYQRSCWTTKGVVVGALSRAKEVLKAKQQQHHNLLLRPSSSGVRKFCFWASRTWSDFFLDWQCNTGRKGIWRCHYHGEQNKCEFSGATFSSTCRFLPLFNMSCIDDFDRHLTRNILLRLLTRQHLLKQQYVISALRKTYISLLFL